MAALLSLAAGVVTKVETVALQACNTVPPLRCDTSRSSTMVRVSFTESLDGTPTTSLNSSWTLVAAASVADQTNIGLDSCKEGNSCTPLITPLFLTSTIVRELVAYELELVATNVPYGFVVLKQQASGMNVSILQDPTQLNANISCAGAVAPLSAKGVCPDTAPPITPSLIASQVGGAYADAVMTNASRWLPNSAARQCNGVICYGCPTGGSPRVSTLYTAYAFGIGCSIYSISAPAQQANYELDVFANLTLADGTPLGASIYFTSLSNTGTGGQLPFVERNSATRLARGWFESLSVSAGDKKRLDSVANSLEGGMIVVCNADGSNRPLNQGFFNPYSGGAPGVVPTATGLGGDQSWFYLGPDAAVKLRGSSCGQVGAVTNLAARLTQFNISNACSQGFVGAGLCVPGYLNSQNASNPTTSLTPALIVAQLNKYALDFQSNASTTPPPFLPPLWNPLQPQYYLRTLPSGSYQLVYQPQNFDAFEVTGTYVMQFSNDVVVYGNQTKRVVVNLAKTICTYWTARGYGALQFQVCNYGNDTNNVDFYLQLLGCGSDIHFTNTSAASPPTTIALFDLMPGTCVYTPSLDISSYSKTGNFSTFVGQTRIPLLGICQYIITDSSNQTALVGSFDAPAQLPCVANEQPLRTVVPIQPLECGFWGDLCEGDVEVWLWIVVLTVAIVAVVILIFACVLFDRTDSKNTKSKSLTPTS